MNSQNMHNQIIQQTAEKYKQDGYEVLIEPQANDLPFNIGRYQPDLIVKKPNNGGYVIEVKLASRKITIEHYRDISETVAQHAGWRFLLVTAEDTATGNLLSWEQIVHKKEIADRLISSGENEAAFLSLWSIFEALMRKQAQQVSLPIERFPTLGLIDHLYSQGELSIPQFDMAKLLLNARNQLVHGFQMVEVEVSVKQLQQLVTELITSWAIQAA